ncbi:MAG: GreA/GreB family elongation factor [Candidatus Pacebacteria bacterium]|nr:GreA/GreB family elongation factor [Candidatus Paceibacterota bacterium]
MRNDQFFQTEDGRRRLLDEQQHLQAGREAATLRRIEYRSSTKISDEEGDSPELAALDQEVAVATGRLHIISQIFSLARPQTAPRPTTTDHVQIDHIVTIQRIGNDSCKRRFLLGGHGEENDTLDPPVISYTTLIGKAVLKKEVGDTFRITLPGTETVEYVILKIELRPQRPSLMAANAA